MQKKLNMSLLDEARNRALGIAPVVDPTPTIELVTLPSWVWSYKQDTLFPTIGLSFPTFLERVPPVNAVLELYSAEFPRTRMVEDGPALDQALQAALKHLAKQLAAASPQAFHGRMDAFYFLFWLCLFALNIDHEPEVSWWQEQLECACCVVHLNAVAVCIKLLAGQAADDSEVFRNRLRPIYQKALSRIGAKQVTCDCSEGLTRGA